MEWWSKECWLLVDFTATLMLLRSDKRYYRRFCCHWYGVVFQSEEFRAALFFPRFKYQPLSLCKSPNVQKAVTDYYAVTPPARWDRLRRTASLGFLRSDNRYYRRFYCSLFRTVFPSEEIHAALFFPRFKCTPLSLCKSPNVHITECNYYTVSATPRWGSYGATNAMLKIRLQQADWCY